MALSALKRITTGNVGTDKFQNNVRNLLNELNAPFMNGILVKDVDLTTAVKEISHKLGRTPTGYLILKRSSGEVVFDGGEYTDKIIPLTSTGSVTVDIWVF